MKEFKVDYRIFTSEPLLSSSVDYVFNAIKEFDNALDLCIEVAGFDPQTCEEIIDDFVRQMPEYAGKPLWVQQNVYRLVENPIQHYARISFSSYRIDGFPAK